MTGQTDAQYTTRQAAYDLRKLRGKHLVTLREQVIAPILAGARIPKRGRRPNAWIVVDRDYDTLRVNMLTLFHDLGIDTIRHSPHRHQIVDPDSPSS